MYVYMYTWICVCINKTTRIRKGGAALKGFVRQANKKFRTTKRIHYQREIMIWIIFYDRKNINKQFLLF